MTLARHLGLRVHEIVRLDRRQLVNALKTGVLERVKGKGGKLRDIPLTSGVKVDIAKIVKVTPVGHKVFVHPDEKAHQVIKHIQSWIGNHSKKLTERKVTIHGLRHRYAQERYAQAF